MCHLEKLHPAIHAHFLNSHFTVKKTGNAFAPMAIDQAHEQNNAAVKGEGGAVGITEIPSALKGWMICGPKMERLVGEFEMISITKEKRIDGTPYDQKKRVQDNFKNDMNTLREVMKEMEKPFLEQNDELLILDMKEVVDNAIADKVISTFVEQVVCKYPKSIERQAPCNHKEDGTQVVVHVSDGLEDGYKKFLIRTVDTDVVVLAMAMIQKISPQDLWIAFGTGKKFRYLTIHDMVKGISPKKAITLPFFHAFAGCDTISYFHRKRKKSCWKVWKVKGEATGAFDE